MNRRKIKIVTIGGGTGSSQVLLGLKEYPLRLSAIVSMMDSGGSTGELMEALKVHPMGDIRQILGALANTNSARRDFFNLRFKEGELMGHSAGNIFLAAYEKIYGNFEKAVSEAKEFLGVKENIIPVTLQRTDLVAYLQNGRKLVKEDSLELLSKRGYSFKKLGLTKKVKANPAAIKAIQAAQVIVICPGNPFRSVLPNFLVDGIKQSLRKSKAKKILVANLMNKKGQTDNLPLSQVVALYEKYIGQGVIDCLIYNSSKFPKNFLHKYQLKDELPLLIDKNKLALAKYRSVNAPLLMNKGYKQAIGDVLLRRTAIRHDPQKIAKIIMKIVYSRV